jgi:hypothetical protein
MRPERFIRRPGTLIRSAVRFIGTQVGHGNAPVGLRDGSASLLCIPKGFGSGLVGPGHHVGQTRLRLGAIPVPQSGRGARAGSVGVRKGHDGFGLDRTTDESCQTSASEQPQVLLLNG